MDQRPSDPESEEAREKWGSAVGNSIVSLVIVLFAPLIALFLPRSATETLQLQGVVLILGGGIAIGLGVVSGGVAKGRGLPTTLAIWGAILGFVELWVGFTRLS
jgi:hypothetical protein